MAEMKVEFDGLDKVLATLNPRVYRKALNRTVNDIGAKMKTYTLRK